MGKRVYDSDKILSIDWFKKSFRDVISALGNLTAIASRAVLKHDNVRKHSDESNIENVLLRNSHQILRAQVIAQSIEEVFLCGIRVKAWAGEWIDRSRH